MSACTKFKEHRGQAQRGRLKHLLVTALFGRNEDRQIAVMLRHVARNTHANKKLKKMFFVSACEKFKEHQDTAQQGRLKHLLVTGPSMRLLQGTAIFGRKEKVSACTKFKEHQGTAQRGRLKQLLVTALFGRNEGRQIAAMVRHVARKTHGKQIWKKTQKNANKMQTKC